MRRFLAILTLLMAAPAVQAQGGLSDIFRSVTGALRGGRDAAPQQGATPVLGVRGMDEADAQAAAPASDDYVLMEGWAATQPEAQAEAAHRGLAARPAALKADAPVPASAD
jgi:hypothetical protein